MWEIEFIRCFYPMTSATSKGSDWVIVAFLTSFAAVDKTIGATSSSQDLVFEKEKDRVQIYLKPSFWTR